MSLDVAEVLRQIDDVLSRYKILADQYRVIGSYEGDSWDYLKPDPEAGAGIFTLLRSSLVRFSPDGEKAVEAALTAYQDPQNPEGSKIRCLAGALRALRCDYQEGRLKRFGEMVRSDLFSDFLEMAEHFVKDEGLKDPAAVIAGGVLEQHLRKLCDNRNLPTTFVDAKSNTVPKKLNQINQDLAKAGAYGSNDQKQITAWADIRNDAAHAHYDKYAQQQVVLMVAGIRDFLARNPA